jgi:hypothetical protein
MTTGHFYFGKNRTFLLWLDSCRKSLEILIKSPYDYREKDNGRVSEEERVARYKEYDYSQGKFIPIQFDKQILEGSFEHTLHYLIDNEIDMSNFDARYQNDKTGAPAYDPAILLKIILYAYSKGITSSRKIARLDTK